MTRLLAILGIAILIGCATTQLVPQPVIDRCNGPAGTVPTQVIIASCTHALETRGGLNTFNSAGAFINRSVAYKMQANYDLALADLNAAAHLAPERAPIYTNRAYIYMAQRRYADALHDVELAISLRPEDLRAPAMRAVVLVYLGRRAEGIAELERRQTQAPDAEHVSWATCIIFGILESSERGMTACRRFAAVSAIPTAHNLISAAYMARNDYRNALNEAEITLQRMPDQSLALYLRGFAKRGLGDRAGGDADIRRAISLNPLLGDSGAKAHIDP